MTPALDMALDLALSAVLVGGGIFALVGSYGLMRLPRPMQRLHAPTKATTLGVGGALLASMLYFWAYQGRFSWHEVMITIFLLMTAPITAQFIAKVQLHQTVRRPELPDTGTGQDWAGQPRTDEAPAPPAPASD